MDDGKMKRAERARAPHRLALVGLLVIAACGDKGAGDTVGPPRRPPATVAAVNAATEDFAPRLLALGTVTPVQTVAVRARADGEIRAITFNEGDRVRAGQVLFRLDDRQARAQLAQAQAQLESAQAAAAAAQADYERALALAPRGFISGTVVDQRKGLVGTSEAAVSAARAQIQAARTQLSFLTITAPVSGRTGELGFRLGNVVRANDVAPLVTINQIDPIQVRFLIPPEQIAAVRAGMARGRLTAIARVQGAGGEIARGRLAFLDNNVNAGNGGIAAKAEFVNTGDQLWPGAIVDIELPLGVASARIAVPESAVQTGRDTPYVWTVAGGKAAMRPVEVAGRFGGKAYLAAGVEPGEPVLVEALARLKEGDPVRIKGGADGGTAAPQNAQAASERKTG